MEKNHKKVYILITFATILALSVSSYAYFSAYFKDEREEENNGTTSLKICNIAQATTISDIPDSVGSFSSTNIYPGHKEVMSFKVSAKGSIGSTSSFKIKYNIEENGLKDNVKISVYKSDEEVKVNENYYNCQKETGKLNNDTIFYETCEEKKLGILLQETVLKEEKEVTIASDTLIIRKDGKPREQYYYVVIEFMNIEESQNTIMNTTLKGKVNIELTTEESKYKEPILNGMDPVIKDELIPIVIESDGTVYKASEGEEWYSYEKQSWANAVILKDEKEEYCPGEIIPEEAIESYFVWIPKYRYQLWDLGNYDSLTEIDEAKVHIIPLIFGDYNTKDQVEGECTTPMESGETGNCKVGDYMTHPAFISIPSTGFWVGKFETSKSNDAEDNSINPEGIQIKPNVVSWQNIQVANAFYTTYDYKRNLDSHMMKNTEWGAVAYLQHSEYGSHAKIRINNNSDYITGYANVTEPTCGWNSDSCDCNRYGTTSDITLPYNTETGYLASTTGNITGIYDMSGGTWEYVMGVMQDMSGNMFTGQNASNHSGFIGNYGEGGNLTVGHKWPNSKYYDVYKYGTTISKFANGILGDATKEMGPFFQVNYTVQNQSGSWYFNRSRFAYMVYPLFERGGTVPDGVEAGIFAFSGYKGKDYKDIGYRLVLTPTE